VYGCENTNDEQHGIPHARLRELPWDEHVQYSELTQQKKQSDNNQEQARYLSCARHRFLPARNAIPKLFYNGADIARGDDILVIGHCSRPCPVTDVRPQNSCCGAQLPLYPVLTVGANHAVNAQMFCFKLLFHGANTSVKGFAGKREQAQSLPLGTRFYLSFFNFRSKPLGGWRIVPANPIQCNILTAD
jgi:hypothetical protein